MEWHGFRSGLPETHRSDKKGLGIQGIASGESTRRHVPGKGQKEKGAQIDLLIDRKDRCINICEMKFYTADSASTNPMQVSWSKSWKYLSKRPGRKRLYS